jgi:hypothetical protein
MSESRIAPTLALHGALVLLFGLLAGIPYGSAIVGDAGVEAVRAWKLAHMEGLLNGVLLLALAGVAPHLHLGEWPRRVMVWGVVLAAWGNLLGATLGALVGERGLEPRGPVANAAVFTAFMFGMWGVLFGVPIVARGAWAALRRADAD